MDTITRFLKEDVVFKLHPKNKDIVSKFIPSNRIIDGTVSALISRYDTIYCFATSTIRADCEMSGKKYILI